jgi:hypothetical protein
MVLLLQALQEQEVLAPLVLLDGGDEVQVLE